MGKEESGRNNLRPRRPPLALAVLAVTIIAAAAVEVAVAGITCTRTCGEVDVPYPFGLEDDNKNCYYSDEFVLTCDRSSDTPKLLNRRFDDKIDYRLEVAAIMLPRGLMRILSPISYECYDNEAYINSTYELSVTFPDTFALSSSENVFTAVGCQTETWLATVGDSWVGCMLGCSSLNGIRDGQCLGTGCCQVDIPEKTTRYETGFYDRSRRSDVSLFNNCSYSFPVERGNYSFRNSHIGYMALDTKLPLILDWFVGNERCPEAEKNPAGYACLSSHSQCLNSTNGPGYICNCSLGYEGNPYVKDGCQDIDECKLDRKMYPCQGICINTKGSYNCVCPKDTTSLDPYTQVCVPNVGAGGQLSKGAWAGIAVAVAFGILSLLSTVCVVLYMKLKERRERMEKEREKERERMEKESASRENKNRLISHCNEFKMNAMRIKYFPLTEMENATNKFARDRLVGSGGFGNVYIGVLMDKQSTVVAIKRAKKLDEKEAKIEVGDIEPFINEAAILSQLDHRNVVRFFGCCVETEIPLLVYEYLPNGTLYRQLHNESGTPSSLSWDERLRIALEIASAVSYMHNSATKSCFHRDLKSANVLMDEKLTAKLSDFGTTKPMQTNQNNVQTNVQGTWGYMDPESVTGLLTEKADVYSWCGILLELLTGETVLTSEGKSLYTEFMSAARKDRVEELIESQDLLDQIGEEELQVLIDLVERCSKPTGVDRPTIREVETELLNLRNQRTHPRLGRGGVEAVTASGLSPPRSVRRRRTR